MKVTKEINHKQIDEVQIVLTLEEATLVQTAVLQFAENIANRDTHKSKMRRLAMLIDKIL